MENEFIYGIIVHKVIEYFSRDLFCEINKLRKNENCGNYPYERTDGVNNKFYHTRCSIC